MHRKGYLFIVLLLGIEAGKMSRMKYIKMPQVKLNVYISVARLASNFALQGLFCVAGSRGVRFST